MQSKFVISFALLLSAALAFAKTTTWVGATGNWSTAGNWNNGVPGSGDTVILASTSSGAKITNDKGAMSLQKLSFKGSNALTFSSAGAITLAGDSSAVIIEDSATAAMTVEAPIVLGRSGTNTVSITASSEMNLYFKGVISGSGNLTLKGTYNSSSLPVNKIHFSGNNTFSGGLTYSRCRVYAEGTTNSLGVVTSLGAAGNLICCTENTSSGSGSHETVGTLYLKVAGTWPYDFQSREMGKSGSFWSPVLQAQPMTFTGRFLEGGDKKSRTRMLAATVNGDFYFEGEFNFPNETFRADCTAGRNFHFKKRMNYKELASGSWFGSGCWLYLYAQTNTFLSSKIGGSSNVKCMGQDIWDHSTGLGFGGHAYAGYAIFDMNGYDQTAAYFYYNGSYTASTEDWKTHLTGRIVKSATPATFYLRDAKKDAKCWTEVDGKVSLVWDPAGDYTQTMMGRTNQTDGSISVLNGTFRITEGCTFAQLSALNIGDNAKFDMACTNEGALAQLSQLTIGDGGSLVSTIHAKNPFQNVRLTTTLASTAIWTINENLTINRLVVGGERLKAGKYSATGASDSTKLTQLAGSGIVTVTETEVDTVDATWKVGGVTVNLTDPTNWEEGQQDFDATSLRGTFNVGTEAVVNYYAKMKGLIIGGAAGEFIFSGSKLMAVYQDGITVAEGKTLTISAPLEIGSQQTWKIGANGALNINGGMTGLTGGEVVTKTGLGAVHINSASGDIGPITFGEKDAESAGIVYINVDTNAFGTASDEKTVTIKGANMSQTPNCTELYFKTNSVVERPIVVNCNVSDYRQRDLYIASGQTVRFTKLVDHGAHHSRVSLAGTAIYEGGFNLNGSAQLILYEGGNIYFRNEPIYLNYLYLQNEKFHLETTNNTINAIELRGGSGVFEVTNPYGLNMPNGRLLMSASGAKLKFTGDQDIGYICTTTGGEITSDTPSTVHFHLLKNGTVSGTACKSITNKTISVTGAVTMYFHGEEGAVFAQNTTATTTGGFGVDSGTLQLLSGATLANAQNFIVENTGRLEIVKKGVLSSSAKLKVDSSASVKLDADQTVSELFVDGLRKRKGVYGAVGSGAQYTLTNFEGKGKLTVSGMQSMVISFER